MFGVTVAATAVAAPAIAEVVKPAVLPAANPYELAVPPEGVTYNWKRVFIDTETPDFEHLVKMIAQGWKPVPLTRHREQFPELDIRSYWIELGGVVLMERPTTEKSNEPYPLPFG
jgi:hypothetical protein